MLKKTTDWDLAKTRAKLIELMEPGVLGFYKSVEITEILAFEGKKTVNVLTLAVAEPSQAPSEEKIDWRSVLLNDKRIKVQGVSCSFGVARYRLSVCAFLKKVSDCESTGHWRTSPQDIISGALAPTPPQFIPADADQPHPWNGVLKNNFFEGSHTLELFDTTKEHLQFLFDDSRRLTELAESVRRWVPIKLDGMSDRLGNIIIQLPVTVLSTVVRNSPGGEHRLGIAWHPEVPPRKLQITAEILDDSALSSFDSTVITTGEATLELNARGGGGRIRIWDLEKRVLLGATPAVRFFTSMTFGSGLGAGKNREFRFNDFDGQELTTTLSLERPSVPGRQMGSPPERPREPWVSERVFRESISTLRARREFVQYGLPPKPAQASSENVPGQTGTLPVDAEGQTTLIANSKKHHRKTAALNDLRYLMREHGREGVWLWDPYLTADDVLRTLFYCPHDGVQLRALTAGKTIIESAKPYKDQVPDRQPEQKKSATAHAERVRQKQIEKLEAFKGNCQGLQLEFRIREGAEGWAFHDRFIIFPRAQRSALVWSLGTSINSFGAEHHILQKVTHGEAIAQAFQELWNRLQGDKYLVWKYPRDMERES